MAFHNELVTLPHPFEPDVEIERQFGQRNFSSTGGAGGATQINCTKGTFGISRCIVNGSSSSSGSTGGIWPIAEEYTAWVGASEDILFFTFPIMLLWGMLSCFISLVVLLRQISISTDSYLIGYVIGNILLLVCGGILKTEDYIGHQNWFQHMYGHIKTVNDWLWYTCLWLLVVMILEKGSMVNQRRHRSVCTTVQAFVVTILVYIVCAVSALPQIWEYEATETFDYLSNRSIVMSQQSSDAAQSPAYRLVYFWYVVSVTVLVPYPVLVGLIGILVKGMRYAQRCRRRMPNSHGSGHIVNKKVSEEIHMLRFFIVTALLYIFLTGPFTFLNLVDHLYPRWNWPVDSIYPGLYCIFQFMFYFYFTTSFFLLCSYNDKFRQTLMKTCCCCCCCCCNNDERKFSQLKQEP